MAPSHFMKTLLQLQTISKLYTYIHFEINSAFQFSPEECRQMLMQFGVREITPASVAKVLGMMARTPTGLNVDQVVIS